jgi:hypothetical protein
MRRSAWTKCGAIRDIKEEEVNKAHHSLERLRLLSLICCMIIIGKMEEGRKGRRVVGGKNVDLH